jgi:hypothetical protein
LPTMSALKRQPSCKSQLQLQHEDYMHALGSRAKTFSHKAPHISPGSNRRMSGTSTLNRSSSVPNHLSAIYTMEDQRSRLSRLQSQYEHHAPAMDSRAR